MMTLTEFLLARIAEDEAWATLRRGAGDWRAPIARRVLVECEAKRLIAALHQTSGDIADHCITGVADYLPTPAPYPCPTLRALASVYADHSDYRQEWAL